MAGPAAEVIADPRIKVAYWGGEARRGKLRLLCKIAIVTGAISRAGSRNSRMFTVPHRAGCKLLADDFTASSIPAYAVGTTLTGWSAGARQDRGQNGRHRGSRDGTGN